MEKLIRLPHVTDYNDLFDHSSFDERGFGPLGLTEGKNTWTLSHRVMVQGREGYPIPSQIFFAAPSRLMAATVMEHLLPINRDVIRIEILVGADGNCLVTAEHGRNHGWLLNDVCWLSNVVRVETLPRFLTLVPEAGRKGGEVGSESEAQRWWQAVTEKVARLGRLYDCAALFVSDFHDQAARAHGLHHVVDPRGGAWLVPIHRAPAAGERTLYQARDAFSTDFESGEAHIRHEFETISEE